MALFALKQSVDFYRNQDSPLYICFLDAEKAFNTVNHWTLEKKLLREMLHCISIAYCELLFRRVYTMSHYQWHSDVKINGIRQREQLLLLLYLGLSGRAGTLPIKAINCFVPWGSEATPKVSCSRPNGSDQNKRLGDLESVYIPEGEAPPLDVKGNSYHYCCKCIYTDGISECSRNQNISTIGGLKESTAAVYNHL